MVNSKQIKEALVNKALIAAVVIIVATPFLSGISGISAVNDNEKLLAMINSYRASKGLSSLSMNTSVSDVASRHSKNMHDKNELNHVLDGKSPSDRLNDAGIGFLTMVENVAFNMGYSDPVQVCFDGWVKSPGHNANMLNSDITDAGIGIYYSQARGWWFTFMGIKPKDSGNKTEPTNTQTVELTMKQGTSINYALTFRNTGQTKLEIKTSVESGFAWLSIQPSSVVIEPGKAYNFSAKLIVSATMELGQYEGKVIFDWGGGKNAYLFKVTVIENPNLPKPNFEVVCPKSVTIPFESGAYTYISVVIKNTGNVDINPRAVFSCAPEGLLKTSPDSGFLTGKISKNAQFTAKIMLVVLKQSSLNVAYATITFSDQGVTRTCTIEIKPGAATNIAISGPQSIALDFAGKSKVVTFTATNTGSTKALLVPEVYYGANSCLIISFEATGKGTYIEPGKFITIKVTFKLRCAPQAASIPCYIKVSRVIGKEQSSKIYEFKLVK